MADLIFNFSKLSKLQYGSEQPRIRCKYWATRSSIRSFARTTHSFACSALLALLARSAALIRLFARSLVKSEWWMLGHQVVLNLSELVIPLIKWFCLDKNTGKSDDGSHGLRQRSGKSRIHISPGMSGDGPSLPEILLHCQKNRCVSWLCFIDFISYRVFPSNWLLKKRFYSGMEQHRNNWNRFMHSFHSSFM